MPTLTIRAARTQLSRLIARAEAGEEIVIARGTVPAVRLVRIAEQAPRRRFGALAGKMVVTAAFDETLPEDELTAWEG